MREHGKVRRAAVIAVTLLAMISLMATSKSDPNYPYGTSNTNNTRRGTSGATTGGASGTGSSGTRVTPRGAAQRFGVGDPVRLGKMTVTVEAVEDPYRPANRRPADGRYVAMDIVVTNNGELPETLSLRECFEVQDRSGWASNLVPATKSESEQLDGVVSGGGGKRTGRVLVDVPDDVVFPELHFTCELLSDGNAVVSIDR